MGNGNMLPVTFFVTFLLPFSDAPQIYARSLQGVGTSCTGSKNVLRPLRAAAPNHCTHSP